MVGWMLLLASCGANILHVILEATMRFRIPGLGEELLQPKGG